jgi:hypothetical protein
MASRFLRRDQEQHGLPQCLRQQASRRGRPSPTTSLIGPTWAVVNFPNLAICVWGASSRYRHRKRSCCSKDPTPSGLRAALCHSKWGTLVKVHTRVSIVYGMVTSLRVPLPSLEPSDKDLKLVELEFAGEIQDTSGGAGFFQRGVSAYPALDEPVYLASAADLAHVYAPPKSQRLESARSTRMGRYRPTFWSMSSSASTSASSAPPDRENPAVSPRS